MNFISTKFLKAIRVTKNVESWEKEQIEPTSN